MDQGRFAELLAQHHTWPCEYTFKFVVAKPHLQTLLDLVPEGEAALRPSSGDKYVSVTWRLQMQAPEDVLALYNRVSKVESLIAL